MYVFIHICIYTHICVYIYMTSNIYIYIYIYIHISCLLPFACCPLLIAYCICLLPVACCLLLITYMMLPRRLLSPWAGAPNSSMVTVKNLPLAMLLWSALLSYRATAKNPTNPIHNCYFVETNNYDAKTLYIGLVSKWLYATHRKYNREIYTICFCPMLMAKMSAWY